jgi:hypothetical protein
LGVEGRGTLGGGWDGWDGIVGLGWVREIANCVLLVLLARLLRASSFAATVLPWMIDDILNLLTGRGRMYCRLLLSKEDIRVIAVLKAAQ